MQPHTAPSRAPSDQVAHDAAHAAVGMLELVGLPAAVIGPTGRWTAINPRFERLIPNRASKRRGHLRLVSSTADALLCNSLARLAHERDWEDVHAIPVPAADTRPPIILHVIPVRGPATDLLPGAVAIVIAAPVVSRDIPSAAVLQGLFNIDSCRSPRHARGRAAAYHRRNRARPRTVAGDRAQPAQGGARQDRLHAQARSRGHADERVPADRPGRKVNTLPPARERIPIG